VALLYLLCGLLAGASDMGNCQGHPFLSMIKRNLFLLAFLFWLLPQYGFSQPQQADSLQREITQNKNKQKNSVLYNLLGVAFMKTGVLDSAYLSFKNSLSANTGNTYERVKSLSEIGNILSITGQQKTGLDTLGIALKELTTLSGSIDVQRLKVRVFKYMGDLYSRNGIYDKSTDYLLQSTSIAKELKDDYAIAKNSSTIAINLAKLKDYKKAIQYNNEAVQFFENSQDKINIAKVYTNIATQYKEQNVNDSASLYISKAETLYSQENYILGIPNLLSLKAEILANESKYREAIIQYKKLIDLDSELGLESSLGYDYQALGFIFQKNKQLDSSNYYLQKSLPYFERAKMNKELSNTLNSLSNNYLEQKNTLEAKKYFTLYNTVNEAYINDERILSISNAEIRYETAIKEAQLTQQAVEIKTTKQKNTWLIAGALLLALITVVLIALNRIIKRKNKIIKGQKEEILHFHDNSLMQLRSMFKRQSELQLLGENVKTNEERVKTLSILHELLHGDDNFSGNLKEYLEKICDIKSKETDINIVCDIPHTIQLKPSFLKDIGIITNEILTNAVKYAFNNTATKLITLKAVQQNSNIFLHIADNGQGLPAGFNPQKTTGFGMGYVTDLVEQHDGEIKFYNKEGANFEVKLAI
jgi:two-component system, sensor histidine kinase PdtaS